MSIFLDDDGAAIKFFIQKDVPEQLKSRVTNTITRLGGRVEDKVPRAGYVLIQPDTPEGIRLRSCWLTADRPERFVVPYTFVEICESKGVLLKQIFVHEGRPIGIHIHRSISNVIVRGNIAAIVSHSGGDPDVSEEGARVILADNQTTVFMQLVKEYESSPGKYIEHFEWINKCIAAGRVSYTPSVYKNPGGRRPGEERTQFTNSDEQHLCEYIALKIPFKESGGRTGNRLYQQLCEKVNEAGYGWVSRHTWQSWRERYKKNSTRLDVVIANIVSQRPVVPGEKGQYGYVRFVEEKAKKPKKPLKQDSPVPLDLCGASGSTSSSVRNSAPTSGNLVYRESAATNSAPPQSALISVADTLRTATLTSFEESQEGSEWAIRVGDAPPPAWSKKRGLSQEDTLEDDPKRRRVDPGINDGACVREVAAAYRFDPTEVAEYYLRVNQNAERTRRRFEKARKLLDEMSDVE